MEFITTFRLHQLPLPYKFLLTCFLITLGVGYLISLVNLNFQYSMLDG